MDIDDLRRRCESSLLLRRYQQALAEADELVDNAPDAEAYILKARGLEGLEQPKEARDLIRKALTLFPAEELRLSPHEAMALYRLREGHEAIKIADRALQKRPGDEWAAKAKAGSLRMHLHDLKAARQAVEEALAVTPDSAILRAEYGAILFGSTPPDYERAFLEASRALDCDPLSEVALHTKATILIKRRDPVAAGNLLTSALARNSDNVFVLNLLAQQALEARGDATEAIRHATKARELNPASELAGQVLIHALTFSGQNAKANETALDVIAAYPAHLTPRLLLFDMQMADGNFVAAEKTLEAIEAAFPQSAQVLTSRIELYRRRGEVGRAINFGYTAVKQLPSSPGVRVRTASTCALRRSFRDAHNLLDEAPADDSFLRISRILLHIIEGNFETGLNAVRHAEKLYPEVTQIQTLKAWLLGNNGEFDEAHRLLDEACDRLPLNELPHVVKLDVLMMQGRIAEAADVADQWRIRFADSHDFNVTAAQVYMQAVRKPLDDKEGSGESRIKEALQHIEKVERMDRSSTIALQIKSMVLHRLGRTAEAMDVVEAGLTQLPYSVGLLAQRGYLRWTAGDEDLAERDFLAVIARTPAGLLARTSLGQIAYSRRDYKKAQEHFGAVVSAQPHSIVARTNLAWSCTATGDPSDLTRAEHECMKALDSDSKNARAIGCRSAVAYHRKQRHTAEMLLITAVGHDPSDVELRVNLGGLQSRMGKYDTAEQTLRGALALQPDHVRCLVELSQLTAKMGDLSQARLFARRAIDSDPASPAGWRAMAGALAAESNMVDAEKALRQALARVDDDESDTIRLDLARILTLAAGKDPSDVRYGEALEHISSVTSRSSRPEAMILLAIAQLKTGSYADAESTLARIPDLASTRAHVRSLQQIARSYQKVESRGIDPRLRSTLLALMLTNNVAIVYLRATNQLDSTAFGVLLPLLLGLAIVAVALPHLTLFKVASVEAQLSIPTREHRHEIITGPALDLDMPPTAQLVIGTLSFDN
jgi:tetratricopeptide (TPR) repeat protein